MYSAWSSESQASARVSPYVTQVRPASYPQGGQYQVQYGQCAPNPGQSANHGQSAFQPKNERDVLGLPSSFITTEECLDSTPVSFFPGGEHKLTLRRNVKATPTSTKTGIANCPIQYVPVAKLCHRGWDDYALRAISHGQDVFPVIAHHKDEAIFLNKLLTAFRRASTDVHKCAIDHYWEVHGVDPPSKFETGAKVFDPLIQNILNCMESCHWQPETEALSHAPSVQEKHSPSKVDHSASQDEKIKRLEETMRQFAKTGKIPQLSPSKPHHHLPVQDGSLPSSSNKSHTKAVPTSPELSGEITPAVKDEQESCNRDQDKPKVQLTGQEALHPTGTVLADRPPNSHTPLAIKKWIEALELFSPKIEGKPTLLEYISLVEKSLKNMDSAKPDVHSLAVRWGLPLQLVSKLSVPQATKVSAVAAWLAS